MNSKLILASLILSNPIASTNSAYSQKVSEKKNILFIAVDDLKPLLGCYGDPVAKTPNIDHLASRGSLFTGSYCQQAVSGPSRASLLTGMCPDRTQVWDLKTEIRSKNPDVVTLPQHMKNSGYETVGIGKIFDPRSVDKQYDERSWSVPYLNADTYMDSKFGEPVLGSYQSDEVKALVAKFEKEAIAAGKKKRQVNVEVMKKVKPSTECADVPDGAYFDGGVANGAVEYINKQKGDKPFMLAVGFKKPHLPFCAPKKYWDLYQRDKMPLAEYRKKAVGSPDFAYHNAGELNSYTDIPPLVSFSDIENVVLPDSKARELIHGYYASISYMDAQVGKVIQALEKKGLDKNTVIVLWGDHGWHLGDHGLWNKHTNFEQAARTPLLIIDPSKKSNKVATSVEFLDIYPTLCELAGVSTPSHLDGTSLAPLMVNPTNEKAHKPYAASQYPRNNKMGYSIRTAQYRYTVWVDWSNKMTNTDKVYAEELYDYKKDPNETANMMKDPAYSAVVKEMKSHWEDYKKSRLN